MGQPLRGRPLREAPRGALRGGGAGQRRKHEKEEQDGKGEHMEKMKKETLSMWLRVLNSISPRQFMSIVSFTLQIAQSGN